MKQVILIVLDGWGIGPDTPANPLTQAKLPTIKEIERLYPSTQLRASGISVGLLWGEPGNSEAGHLTLGAGKVIYQHLPRIILSIRSGSFFKNPALVGAIDHIRSNNSTLHIMGMISSGGVHSYIDHLYALLDLAKMNGISERTVIHIFTDGRDAPPKEGMKFITNLQERLEKQRLGKIGTIIGRLYPMDRDDNWDRTEKAYNLLTKGEGSAIQNPVEYVKESYKEGITDEFIEPAVVGMTEVGPPSLKSEAARNTIQDGDAVIFFNFREDSTRQLTKAFVLDEFDKFPRQKLQNLYFCSMTEYEKGLPTHIAFMPAKIVRPLGKVISEAGLKQLRLAETEKYAHITYFFNGLKEKPFPEEDRILIPSSKDTHFDENPEMKAPEITKTLIEKINPVRSPSCQRHDGSRLRRLTSNGVKLGEYSFVLANFANGDMVAHTGNFEAAVKTAEVIDQCIAEIIREVLEKEDATLIITSDHGNVENMLDLTTGEVRTEHTINPVPFYLIGKRFRQENSAHDARISTMSNVAGQMPAPYRDKVSGTGSNVNVGGLLADVAPTVLELLGIEKPKEMTGQSLLKTLIKN